MKAVEQSIAVLVLLVLVTCVWWLGSPIAEWLLEEDFHGTPTRVIVGPSVTQPHASVGDAPDPATSLLDRLCAGGVRDPLCRAHYAPVTMLYLSVPNVPGCACTMRCRAKLCTDLTCVCPGEAVESAGRE